MFQYWLPIGKAILLYILLSLLLSWLALVFVCGQFSVLEPRQDWLSLLWPDPSNIETTESRISTTQLIAAIWGGLAVIFNLYYGAKRSEVFAETAKANAETANANSRNAKAAEDGQITERFSRSVEQLGSEKIETRIGGIYSLERIASDSLQDHWSIIEILTAFIREKSPIQNADVFIRRYPIKNKSKNNKTQNSESDEVESSTLDTDIQAALTVIGRRKYDRDPESKQLNLSLTDLNTFDASSGYFRKALFEKSYLERTNLRSADLQGARLQQTDLREADLRDADLQGARLQNANLQFAYLKGANLQEARLQGTNMQMALLQTDPDGVALRKINFQRADLRLAKLQRGNLQDANLKGADLQEANLQEAHLQNAMMKDSKLQWVNFEGTNLQGANLEGANLQYVDLCHTKGLQPKQVQLAKGSRSTTWLPAPLRPSKEWDNIESDLIALSSNFRIWPRSVARISVLLDGN